MKWYWLLISLPLIFGLGIGLYLNYVADYNPILYARADLGTVIVIFGFLLSFATGIILGAREVWNHTRTTQAEALLRASEEHRKFLQRLDHELKNPLTAILAGLANLKEEIKDIKIQETLSSVEFEVRRLSRLVSDLRKLSELESRPIECAPVNLTDIIDDALDLAKELPDAKNREFIVSVPRAPWPLPEISVDRDLIFLALHNLLTNAVKFTAPGDTIEVRAYEDNQKIVVEVADTGPGIPEAEVPFVWQELYRGVSARGTPGSGLGLALVKAIIKKHNGEISLRSRENQGTVVTIHLPIS